MWSPEHQKKACVRRYTACRGHCCDSPVLLPEIWEQANKRTSEQTRPLLFADFPILFYSFFSSLCSVRGEGHTDNLEPCPFLWSPLSVVAGPPLFSCPVFAMPSSCVSLSLPSSLLLLLLLLCQVGQAFACSDKYRGQEPLAGTIKTEKTHQRNKTGAILVLFAHRCWGKRKRLGGRSFPPLSLRFPCVDDGPCP